MADEQEPASGDDGSLRPYIPRLVVVGVTAVLLGILVYLTRNLLGPLFDKAYEALAEWTGRISAAGIAAGASVGMGALLLWREWSFVKCFEDGAYFKRIFNLERSAFLLGVAETLTVAALGAFLVMNGLSWVFKADNEGHIIDDARGNFFLIAALAGVVFSVLDEIKTPAGRFYFTLTVALGVTLAVLWSWAYVIPAETDHGYLAWAAFFGVVGWLVWRAWKNDPEARIHNARLARVCAYLVTGYVVLVLLFRWFQHGWLSALLSIDNFAYVVVIAWLWVKLSVDPSAAKRTFFGLPFVRHKQNRAFAWLRRVNPFGVRRSAGPFG